MNLPSETDLSVDFSSFQSLEPNQDSYSGGVAATAALHEVITRTMAEGVCLVRSSDGVIVYANPKFERMFGYDPGELAGRHISIVNYEHNQTDGVAVYQSLAQQVSRQGEATYEVRNVKKDGTPFWCQATTSVFEHPDHGTVFVAVQQDITLRKQAQAELCQLNAELEARVIQRTAQLAESNREKEAALARERSAREQAERTAIALQHSEARYRAVIAATSHIIWSTQTDGEVVDEQPGWSAFTGQKFAELKGWSWISAVHPDDRHATAQAWLAALKNRTLYHVEHRLRRHDGEYRYMSVNGVPVLEADGSVREWVGIHTDVTERKQSEQVLLDHAAELSEVNRLLAQTATLLEERNRELDQFAYVASHDLKAPLRAIANLSEWIEDDLQGQLPEENQHQMKLLRSRVLRMEALINGLLLYSRIGRTQASIQSVSVGNLLAEIIDSLDPPASFQIEIAPEMPTLVTREILLRQVFANLLSNAIKHHPRPDGHISISVQDKRSHYEFAVSDDGQGIDPDYHDRIFVIFQTLETRDNNENTGVGLAIVKKIVETEGGTVRVESQVGEGTTFRFTWLKQSR